MDITAMVKKYRIVNEWQIHNKTIKPDDGETERKTELYNKINKLEKESIIFTVGTISDELLNKFNAEIARLKDILYRNNTSYGM